MIFEILLAVVPLFLIILYGNSIIRFVQNRRRVIRLVDQLPGPHALPLIGCAYQFAWSSKRKSRQKSGNSVRKVSFQDSVIS